MTPALLDRAKATPRWGWRREIREPAAVAELLGLAGGGAGLGVGLVCAFELEIPRVS